MQSWGGCHVTAGESSSCHIDAAVIQTHVHDRQCCLAVSLQYAVGQNYRSHTPIPEVCTGCCVVAPAAPAVAEAVAEKPV